MRYHLTATDIQKVASFAFTLRQTRFLAKYRSDSPESGLDLLPYINKPLVLAHCDDIDPYARHRHMPRCDYALNYEEMPLNPS